MSLIPLCSRLIDPALPAGGGVVCCAALLVIWRRSHERHVLLWVAACLLETAAGTLAFVHARTNAGIWLGLGAAAQALALLMVVIATRHTARWIERQNLRVRILAGEMERLRNQGLHDADVDRLTGLLNQSALAKRMERLDEFRGVVVVCDMDNFKEINDQFGHLVGDEILRNVGQLLRASIRPHDEAFRWGGDEFVVLFHNQDQDLAQRRMQDVSKRLGTFQVRGHGMVPLSFSWGVADGRNRTLREALDDADRKMYAGKRRQWRRPAGEAADTETDTGG